MRFSVFHFLFRCFSVAGFSVHPYVPTVQALFLPKSTFLPHLHGSRAVQVWLMSRASVCFERCKCGRNGYDTPPFRLLSSFLDDDGDSCNNKYDSNGNGKCESLSKYCDANNDSRYRFHSSQYRSLCCSNVFDGFDECQVGYDGRNNGQKQQIAEGRDVGYQMQAACGKHSGYKYQRAEKEYVEGKSQAFQFFVFPLSDGHQIKCIAYGRQ